MVRFLDPPLSRPTPYQKARVAVVVGWLLNVPATCLFNCTCCHTEKLPIELIPHPIIVY